MLFGFGLYMFLFLFCWFYFKPSSVKNHSRFAVAHCVSSAITLHTGGFIAGMGSKTRSVEIFRVHNRSGNSQTVELSLITFVRDVTNPSSLLASFQQEEKMLHAAETNRTERWQAEKEFCESAHLVFICRPGVLLEAGVHSLSKLLHP